MPVDTHAAGSAKHTPVYPNGFAKIAIAILAKPFGYTGVCFADPAAWVSTGILLIITYFIWEIRMKKKLAMQEQLQQGL